MVVVHPCAPVGAGKIKPTVTGQREVDFRAGTMPSYLPGGINFVDVEDVAKGHFLAAVRGRIGGRYILGSRNLSLADFLGVMALVTGSKVPDIGRRNPLVAALKDFRERHAAPTPMGGPQSLTCDCSRAVLELELPQTPLEIALEKAVNWFLGNGYVKGRRGNKWIS